MTDPKLTSVLGEMRRCIAMPHNDFGFSGWRDRDHALADLDALATALGAGDRDKLQDLVLLFAPTGALQEVSMASGWADAYLSLSERFDAAVADMRA